MTPFGSILKSIRFKLEQHGQTAIEKVYFYWISRDKNAFEWFSEVLAGSYKCCKVNEQPWKKRISIISLKFIPTLLGN